MKLFKGPDRILDGPVVWRPLRVRVRGLVLVLISVPLLAFLASPYIALWRLDQAVRGDNASALADLVDLDAVRGEIKKKLNKDADSVIGELSDPFIRWLQKGIGVLGGDAVDRLVTLPWVRARLLGHTAGDGNEGFLGALAYAFFDAPDGFSVRIGARAENPTRLYLKPRGLQWRITALYY